MHPITKEQLAKFVGEQKSPCISLYMPTHRRHPENQRDPIGFKNLLQEIENTLRQRYPNLEMDEDLAKFHTLSHDDHFWNHRTDGLGILCSPDAFHVFDLQRPVEELLVVADSFHIKPLLRALQATDRYQILGLNRHEAKLYEGNRDALDEIEMNEGVPATIEEALGSELSEAHITVASYGGSGGGLHGVPSTHHGHGQKKDEVEIDNERFFRAIDRAILKHCSQSSKLPLILAALPEHHDLFRRVSHNPFLVEDGIRLDPQSISIERLRTEAWRVMEPHYQQRITKLVDNFEQSQSRQLGESDLMDIAQALIVNRKATPIADIGSGDSHQRFVLALNAGSSSLKIALFHGESEPVRLLSGAIDRIGLSESTFSVKRVGSQETEHATVTAASHASCLDFLLTRLFEVSGHSEFRAAVHRVVHGGPRYVQPEVVTPELLEELRRISPFAPEHLPSAIDLINALQSRFPQLTQIACFDTAFHHDLPRVALMMPIPRRYEALGVRRYGFHGLSYEFLMQELEQKAGATVAHGRVILAHLGNGASLAAVRDGHCLDTSMGFTPAAGLVMGRRSGDLDPGLVAFLAKTEGMTAEQFDELVNQKSGLLGVSEISSDMRELLSLEATDPRAAEAISLFCYQVTKWIGSFAAALGGLDTLVFSGGIGENCASIRTRICKGLAFLGIELNETLNSTHSANISAPGIKVATYVIRTDEELLIARAAYGILGIATSTGC